MQNKSKMLMVSGNKIVYKDEPDKEVRLVGLNIAGLEWLIEDPFIERSFKVATDSWHANVIRLPVSADFWFGKHHEQTDGGRLYRDNIDKLIKMASVRGKYVILDLHHYVLFNQKMLDFWMDAAEVYKNNPTVLFGILNEPHSINWANWRDGGQKTLDDKGNEFISIGHQTVVEKIRDLGAKNIIIAGGIDWGYDLRGIVGAAPGHSKCYALIDQGSNGNFEKTGYGIMYDAHIYPWKGLNEDWDRDIGIARHHYPILIGECGWDEDTIWAIIQEKYPEDSPLYYKNWILKLFDWFDGTPKYEKSVQWTGWCFHPVASPRIIGDNDNWESGSYSYPPTEYWGVYVKKQIKKDLNI